MIYIIVYIVLVKVNGPYKQKADFFSPVSFAHLVSSVESNSSVLSRFLMRIGLRGGEEIMSELDEKVFVQSTIKSFEIIDNDSHKY